MRSVQYVSPRSVVCFVVFVFCFFGFFDAMMLYSDNFGLALLL